jgi:hypothetical protein
MTPRVPSDSCKFPSSKRRLSLVASPYCLTNPAQMTKQSTISSYMCNHKDLLTREQSTDILKNTLKGLYQTCTMQHNTITADTFDVLSTEEMVFVLSAILTEFNNQLQAREVERLTILREFDALQEEALLVLNEEVVSELRDSTELVNDFEHASI